MITEQISITHNAKITFHLCQNTFIKIMKTMKSNLYCTAAVA